MRLFDFCLSCGDLLLKDHEREIGICTKCVQSPKVIITDIGRPGYGSKPRKG